MKTSIDRALDAQHVKRWTLVATAAESNVASHSFNVAVISMALWNEMRNTLHISKYELCYYALLHDLDEVFTGDIPTPTKRALRQKGVEPNDIFIGQGEKRPPEEMYRIIKMADLIENWFFISQHGSGQRAALAAERARTTLDDAIAAAPIDLRTAAAYVLDYIERRKSDEPEEGERIARYSQTLADITKFSLDPGARGVG